jgi:hypothetical protein
MAAWPCEHVGLEERGEGLAGTSPQELPAFVPDRRQRLSMPVRCVTLHRSDKRS